MFIDLEDIAVRRRRTLVVDVIQILREFFMYDVGRNRELRPSSFSVCPHPVADPSAFVAFDGHDSAEYIEDVVRHFDSRRSAAEWAVPDRALSAEN